MWSTVCLSVIIHQSIPEIPPRPGELRTELLGYRLKEEAVSLQQQMNSAQKPDWSYALWSQGWTWFKWIYIWYFYECVADFVLSLSVRRPKQLEDLGGFGEIAILSLLPYLNHHNILWINKYIFCLILICFFLWKWVILYFLGCLIYNFW